MHLRYENASIEMMFNMIFYSSAITREMALFISTFLVFFNSTYQCRQLITFVNKLDPEQARRFVGPDLDPNCLTLW